MARYRVKAAALAGFLVLAACSDSGSSDGTGTTAPDATATTPATATTISPSTTGAGATTTTVPDAGGTSTTTTTLPAVGVPEYSIQARIAGEAGDTVVVFVEPATYSDLDIENLVADVVQRFAPITTLHVIDDAEVVDLVLSEESALSAEELADRDAHYFARLEEGFRLVFKGPFETVPDVILGS